MFLIFAFFFAFALLVLCLLRSPFYRTYKLAQKIKGPNKFWIIGLAYDFVQHNSITFLPYLRKLVENNRGLVRFWMLGTPMVAVVEPEHIKAILANSINLKKGWEYDIMIEVLGDGLINGISSWKERRKLLNPLFNPNNFDRKLTKSIKHARRLVDVLAKKDEPVDTYECLAESTLMYTCETAMEVDVSEEEIKRFRKSYRYLSRGILKKAIKLYLKQWMFRYTYEHRLMESNLKIVDDFADKLIRERRFKNSKSLGQDAEDILGSGRKKSFLDTLVEPNVNRKVYLTATDIRNEVKTFLVVGHESTAVTMSFALFHIAIDEELQKKAYKEQFDIFGDSDRDPAYEDIQAMTYLTQIIKESMRLYPPVPYVSRELQEDTFCGDTLIPKGTNVVTSPYIIHRQEKTFPNPDKFDPERFSPEEVEKRHPYAFIPFGAGPRYCIGQNLAMANMKIYLSTIIRKLKLEKVTELAEVVLKLNIAITTYRPIFIKFLPRCNTTK